MGQTTQIKIKTKPRIFYFKRFKLLIQWHQKTNEQHQAIAQAEQEVEDSNVSSPDLVLNEREQSVCSKGY